MFRRVHLRSKLPLRLFSTHAVENAHPGGVALLLTATMPDAHATAAGCRTLALLRHLSVLGLRPVIATTASFASDPPAAERARDFHRTFGIHCVQIAPNDSQFDEFVRSLDTGAFLAAADSVPPPGSDSRPLPAAPVGPPDSSAPGLSLVIFNEFALEELFSWRVAAAAPHALRAIDTQDLHSLRASRAAAVAAADAARAARLGGEVGVGVAQAMVVPLAAAKAMGAPLYGPAPAEDASNGSGSGGGNGVRHDRGVSTDSSSTSGVSLLPHSPFMPSCDDSSLSPSAAAVHLWASPSCSLTPSHAGAGLPLGPPLPHAVSAVGAQEATATSAAAPAETAETLSASARAGAAAVTSFAFDAASELRLRESSALHRSDLGLFVSRVEVSLATSPPAHVLPGLGLAKHKAAYVPITLPSPSHGCDNDRELGWAERLHFCFLGTGRHAPNMDAVELLRAGGLWARVRAAVLRRRQERCTCCGDKSDACAVCSEPLPELHIYGSHLPPSLTSQSLPAGMRVLGFAPPPLPDLLGRYRCFLAPLRFGAGVKGKLLDAAQAGTPVVGTGAAWEDIVLPRDASSDDGVARWLDAYSHPYIDHAAPSESTKPLSFGTPIDDLLVAFPEHAAEVYESQAAWEQARAGGRQLLQEGFSDTAALEALRRALVGVGFTPVEQNHAGAEDQQEGARGKHKGAGKTALGVTGLVGQLRAPSVTGVAAMRAGDLIGQMLWRDAHRAVDARSKVLEVRKVLRSALAQSPK